MMEYTKGECKCSVDILRFAGLEDLVKYGRINYCPKHKAAPDMYEALREICRRYDEDGILDISPARQALALVEGE